MKMTLKKTLGLVLALVMLLVPMTAAADEEVNYAVGDALTVGTADYAMDAAYPYTVLTFDPTEDGVYTITSDSPMGIVSYITLWVTTAPSTETVNVNTIEWECTEVGQGIMVAVEAQGETATITVTREERVVKPETPWTYYENVVTPEAFTFVGDAAALEYVDTYDDVVDQAILGEDGYYHLNGEDGPILYVDLDDDLMPIPSVIENGQMTEVLADENGDIVVKVNYNDAATEYMVHADAKTMLYPLTIDLITMYEHIGNAKMWYGESGFVGGDLADAWMFACYYIPADEIPDTTTTTTTGGDDTTVTTTTTVADDTAVTTTTTAPVTSPATGDTTNTLVFVAVALLAAGVVTASVLSKKVTAR